MHSDEDPKKPVKARIWLELEFEYPDGSYIKAEEELLVYVDEVDADDVEACGQAYFDKIVKENK